MENYSYNKLKGRIVEKYGTQNAFAKEIGLSTNSLSRKLSGKIGLSQEDIVKWAELLDIDHDDYPEYFFA